MKVNASVIVKDGDVAKALKILKRKLEKQGLWGYCCLLLYSDTAVRGFFLHRRIDRPEDNVSRGAAGLRAVRAILQPFFPGLQADSIRRSCQAPPGSAVP